jgi:predicted N-formylglutamate amidohydrolase
MYITQPSKWVRVVSSANNAKPPHLILLSQHGANEELLRTTHPEFLRYMKEEDREVLESYLRLERDTGATELAYKIAEKMASNYRVRVVEVLLPRGILDPNRNEERALRNVFNPGRKKEAEKLFLPFHRQIVNDVIVQVAKLSPKGLLFDSHSMAPLNPKSNNPEVTVPVEESPGKMNRYIDAWTKSSGLLRPTDLVTESDDGIHREQVADEMLARAIEKAFAEGDVNVVRNTPYPINPRINTTRYLKMKSGVAMDIPKHLLATDKYGNNCPKMVQSSLDNLKVSLEAVEAFSKNVVAALMECLNARNRV